MLAPAALLFGALIGFVGSRRLRRPEHAAQAASVARSVGGNLGRRRGLSAPELQRACFSEMVRHVRVDREGRSTAPARYLLELHPDDLATVDDARRWFSEGLAEALRQAADQHGWRIDGRIELSYEADPGRPAGAPNALAVDPVGPARAAPATAPPSPTPRRGTARLSVRRSDTGDRTSLAGDAISIGRANQRGIVIDDKRVSRDHAVLSPSRTGWTITDRGSANGTVVNGQRLAAHEPRLLAVGDTIGLGPFELVVEADEPPAPGARALDDHERTRISGEVLPPPRRPER
ncbi:MAG: DUF3662 domain-containing protein [Acidimicrobiales bacterium]|nr:DUF3662 domain-containing protein [Acidimicrobiales bacterium]